MNLPAVIILCGVISTAIVCVIVAVAALQRRLPAWAAIVIVVALLLFHGWIGGLPGRIGETIFEHSLKAGSTRADVIRLERRLGGEDRVPDWSLNDTKGAPGIVDVQFYDYGSFYGTSGQWFHLDFAPDWRLESWSVEGFGSFL